MDLELSAALMRVHARSFVTSMTRLGRVVAAAPHRPGGLLAVGTADFEPWHLVAHLQDAARWSGRDNIAPELVRHRVPAGAPPHLAIGLDRLERSGHGETVLVVAAGTAEDDLLERLVATRRRGGTVLALSGAAHDAELMAIAHDGARLEIRHQLDPAMHLLPAAAAGLTPRRRLVARVAGAR